MARTIIAGVLGAALAAAACGGSTDSGLTGGGGSSTGGSAGSPAGGAAGSAATGGSAGAGATSGGGTAGAGGASGGGGTGGYTLDDVCSKISPKICELEKGCCEKSGFGYDANGCTQASLAECEKSVAEVKLGSMTFDPSKVDACLSGFQKALDKCVIDVGELWAVLEALRVCNYVFAGKLPQGAACERDAECLQSPDPDVFVSCSDVTNKCVQAKRLKLNDTCAIGDGVVDFCGPGLFCDAAWSPFPPYPGVCKTATPEGKPCNKFKPYNLECGAGFYCNNATGVCTKAKIGGATCADGLECQSFECSVGKCTAQDPIVSQGACTG